MYKFVLINNLNCNIAESKPYNNNDEDLAKNMILWLKNDNIYLEIGDTIKIVEVE